MTTNPPRPPQTQLQADANKWELIIEQAGPEFLPLAEANGNLVKFEVERRFARDIILANDTLQKCPTASILKAIRNVAAVSLTLDPSQKLAYLVPRDGQCCLDISARGLVKVATDSGAILAAKAVTVREQDRFDYNGPFELPTHKFDIRMTEEQRGAIVACYSAILLPSKATVIEVLTRDHIEQIRAFALAKARDKDNPNLPWNRWTEEMIKKAGNKRGLKSVPPTERLSTAVAVIDETDNGIEYDITPGAVQLPRPGRLDPAQFVQPAPAAADDGRQRYLDELKKNVELRGSTWYTAYFQQKMTKEQRAWLTKPGHDQMWALALQADAQLAGGRNGGA